MLWRFCHNQKGKDMKASQAGNGTLHLPKKLEHVPKRQDEGVPRRSDEKDRGPVKEPQEEGRPMRQHRQETISQPQQGQAAKPRQARDGSSKIGSFNERYEHLPDIATAIMERNRFLDTQRVGKVRGKV